VETAVESFRRAIEMMPIKIANLNLIATCARSKCKLKRPSEIDSSYLEIARLYREKTTISPNDPLQKIAGISISKMKLRP